MQFFAVVKNRSLMRSLPFVISLSLCFPVHLPYSLLVAYLPFALPASPHLHLSFFLPTCPVFFGWLPYSSRSIRRPNERFSNPPQKCRWNLSRRLPSVSGRKRSPAMQLPMRRRRKKKFQEPFWILRFCRVSPNKNRLIYYSLVKAHVILI